MAALIFLYSLVSFILGRCQTSSYVPASWTGLCSENISTLPLSISTALRPSVLVEINCSIPKSHQVHWKLNDLHDWTVNYQINNETTPSNRSVIYNITATCEYGANISLPWPIKVVGLKEVHVSYCHLVDRYKNMHDIPISSISDDLRVLELRHSIWILNETGLNVGDNPNITSRFDCGQTSSLETSITSNVSAVVMRYVNEEANGGGEHRGMQELDDFSRTETKQSSSFGKLSSASWLTQPGTRLNNHTTHIVSDHEKVNSEGKKPTSATDSNPEVRAQDTQLDNIKFIIKMFNERAKCNYHQLRTLDESMAHVTPHNHFEFMIKRAEYPVLENMNYSHIGLQELPRQLAEWRIYFPNLKNLDLTHNSISEIKIPPYPSASNSEVVSFDLRFNNITVINIELLKSLADVDNFFVNMRDNPIHCGCELSPLLPLLKNNSTFQGALASYKYIRELQCNTPKTLAGKQLFILTQDSLLCPDYDTTNRTAVIILGVITITLLAAIITILKFKMEVRILLYTRLHVRLPCDADVTRTHKTFDAFVSYSNEDTEWVRENLMAFLENSQTSVENSTHSGKSVGADDIRKSFKLCVHQRDFLAGKTIFDNIVDSIEASRHTIIVLSPSFMRSHWAMEELRQAYRQSLVEKTRHLIVILLQKVSKDEMDPLIKRCCKTFTYLEAEDSLFRDRLVFSLTTKDKSAKRRDRRLAAKEKRAKEICNQTREYHN